MGGRGGEFGREVVFYVFLVGRVMEFGWKNEMELFGWDEWLVGDGGDLEGVGDLCGEEELGELFFGEGGYVVVCEERGVGNEGVFVDVNGLCVLGGLFGGVGGSEERECVGVEVSGGIGGEV